MDIIRKKMQDPSNARDVMAMVFLFQLMVRDILAGRKSILWK